ncbi:unnamed protein product, partial [Phaeothamnion confervicola]
MPPFIYMLLGTCQQMSFGVTAIESILVRRKDQNDAHKYLRLNPLSFLVQPPKSLLLVFFFQMNSLLCAASSIEQLADSVRGVIGDEVADSDDPVTISLNVQYT